jgi:hypothetical protein
MVDKRQTNAYSILMKHFNWNFDKNELLKKVRGISFEEVVSLINSGKVLGVERSPNYENQKLYMIDRDGCAYLVPFIETENEIFLKTIFPSRKYTKKFKIEI